MTFTDTTGHSDVVNIASNGTYSANLSNLANGTLTYLVTVTDPVGNVTTFDPTVTLGDGSANAPAGHPAVAEPVQRLGRSTAMDGCGGRLCGRYSNRHSAEGLAEPERPRHFDKRQFGPYRQY